MLSTFASAFGPWGYYTIIYKFDAECFGSRASRLRIYFIGWLVVPGGSLAPGPMMNIVKTRYSWLENFIHSFCIDAMPTEKFLAMNMNALWDLLLLCPTQPSSHKRESGDWENEHLEAFRQKGLSWPVNLATGSDAMRSLEEKHVKFMFDNISVRQAELLYYCHLAFSFRKLRCGVRGCQSEHGPVVPQCRHGQEPLEISGADLDGRGLHLRALQV